jgi:two-component system, chemotaxis family, CheB/CheR fusion protein
MFKRGLALSDSDTAVLHGRVLVADDLPDAARSLAMLFELYGAEVRFTLDGGEAVRIAESFRPEIVVLDISMPGMSGYEAARAIRSAPWGRAMVLVALTGWGRSADLEAAHAAGFDGHLLKPVDPQALLDEISRLRERKRLLEP